MEPPDRRKLEGWGPIAKHLNKSETTAQRWEREEGMPVRRHRHRERATPFIDIDELDAWRQARASRRVSTVKAAREPFGGAVLLDEADRTMSAPGGRRSSAFLSPRALGLLLLVSMLWTFAGTVHLFENLIPSRYMNVFMLLVLTRVSLWFVVGTTGLYWYTHAMSSGRPASAPTPRAA